MFVLAVIRFQSIRSVLCVVLHYDYHPSVSCAGECVVSYHSRYVDVTCDPEQCCVVVADGPFTVPAPEFSIFPPNSPTLYWPYTRTLPRFASDEQETIKD